MIPFKVALMKAITNVFTWIISFFNDKEEAGKTNILLNIAKTIGKFAFLVISIVVVVWMSVFIYASVYYSFVPTASYSRPIHFQFNPLCKQKEQSSDQHSSSYWYPKADVALSKSGKAQLFTSGQPYKVFIELEIPESIVNQNLGMFSISVDFMNKKKKLISSSTRSAMLRYRSDLLRIINTFFYSSVLVTGLSEEKQTLKIAMFEEFQDNPLHPSTDAEITMHSCDIQLYNAKLHIEADFRGLRYLMYYWPLSSAFIGIGMSQFFLFTVAFLSWYRFLWPMQKEALYQSFNQTSGDRDRSSTARTNDSSSIEELFHDSDDDDNIFSFAEETSQSFRNEGDSTSGHAAS